MDNAARFRAGLVRAGLAPKPGAHPIVPVMLGEAALAQKFSAAMLDRGIYVTGFSHPVVPRGGARIRTQVSAAHRECDLDRALEAFAAVKTGLGL
jgi:glycine C-acetyltransferase